MTCAYYASCINDKLSKYCSSYGLFCFTLLFNSGGFEKLLNGGLVLNGGGTPHISSKHYMGPTPFYGARAEKNEKTDFAIKQTNMSP